MPLVTADDALLVCLFAAGAAFIGTLSGFGFALLIVPPLAFVFGAKDAVVLSNVLGASWLMAMFVRLRRQVVWRTAAPLMIAAFAGMPFGLLVLQVISARLLQLFLAVNVMAATLLMWRGVRLRWEGRLVDAATGFVSGVLNTSTSMNGPPVVLHLQNQGMAPDPFRATLSAFFTASSLFTLFLYVLGDRVGEFELRAVAAGLPGLALGYVGGNVVVRRLNPAQFRTMVVGILLLSATLLFIRTLTS